MGPPIPPTGSSMAYLTPPTGSGMAPPTPPTPLQHNSHLTGSQMTYMPPRKFFRMVTFLGASGRGVWFPGGGGGASSSQPKCGHCRTCCCAAQSIARADGSSYWFVATRTTSQPSRSMHNSLRRHNPSGWVIPSSTCHVKPSQHVPGEGDRRVCSSRPPPPPSPEC